MNSDNKKEKMSFSDFVLTAKLLLPAQEILSEEQYKEFVRDLVELAEREDFKH